MATVSDTLYDPTKNLPDTLLSSTAPTTAPAPTNGAFNFPMDKFPRSYSGLGPEYQGMLTSLLPQIKGAYEQYPETVKGGYNQAISDAGSSFKNTLQPQLQQILNNLASRNMINSSVAGDTMAGAARGVAQDITGTQAGLGLAREQALAQYPQLLTNLLSQGQYSESTNELAPYQSALGFLQSLMA